MKNVDIDYLSLLREGQTQPSGIFNFEKSYHHSEGLDLQFLNCQIPGILISNWQARADGPASFSAEKAPEAINMNFMLTGAMHSKLHANRSDFQIKGGQNNLIYLENFDGQHTLGDGITSAFHIMFDKAFFCQLIDYNEPQTERIISKIEKKEGFFANKHMMPIKPEMMAIISQMLSCKFSQSFKAIYLQGKALELLSYTLAQAGEYEPIKNRLTDLDVKRISEVKEYLDSNYLNPVSMIEICRMFGLNEHKLKTGFRQLYHNSVFGYVHHKKMQLAEQLIRDGQMSVIQIADRIGYEHSNHFSTAFKKHFGYSPRLAKGQQKFRNEYS